VSTEWIVLVWVIKYCMSIL